MTFLGCTEKSDDVTPQQTVCSVENPGGTCSDAQSYCYRGTCILKGSICGEIEHLAPCYQMDPESGTYITDDKGNYIISQTEVCNEGIDGTFSCVNGPCKISHPTGTCAEGKYCDNGFCSYYCSSRNLYGKCEKDSDKCVEGICYPEAEYCSKDNPKGTCPPEQNCLGGFCWPICGDTYPFGNCVADGTLDRNQECSNNECVKLCSQAYPEGKCFLSSDECRDGGCVSPCSIIAPNGFCDISGESCIGGKCQKPCSAEEPEGGCEWGFDCYEGRCQEKCSIIAVNGYCTSEDKACQEGICKSLCSPENPTGPCSNSAYYCEEGVCKQYSCSAEYPNGVCDNPAEECVQIGGQEYGCEPECSPSSVKGFCLQDGYRCSQQGACVLEADQICDTWFLNGSCDDRNKECQNGVCVLGACSLEHPGGKCSDPAKECQNGVCMAYTCVDGRPLNFDNPAGACCRNDDDCIGNDALSIGFCIADRHPEGPYCLMIEGLGSGCSVDNDCTELYPGDEYDGGNPEDWVCIKAIAPVYETEVSFCQRVENECPLPENDNRLEIGEECGYRCIETKCKSGSYCFRGMCTAQCLTRDGIDENPGCPEVEIRGESRHMDCMPQAFDISGKEISFEGCVIGCKSHNDCLIRPGSYELGGPDTPIVEGTFCNTITKLQENGQYYYQLVCEYGEFYKRGRKYAQCDAQADCGTGACDSLHGQCHDPCGKDDDCGNNQYCSFESKIVENLELVDILGVCRELEIKNSTECKIDSDCDGDLFCIPKVLEDNTIKRFCGRAKVNGWNPVAYNTFKCGNNENRYCLNNMCYGADEDNRYCRALCDKPEDCGEGFTCSEVVYRPGPENIALANTTKRDVSISICLPE